MAELDFEVTDEVDITDKVCPLTFVKAKVAIEELEDGEILAVRMNDGEPVQNVPRSMKEEARSTGRSGPQSPSRCPRRGQSWCCRFPHASRTGTSRPYR